MDSEDEDFGPANPKFQLKLNLGAAPPKPFSQSNRQEATSASNGELLEALAHHQSTTYFWQRSLVLHEDSKVLLLPFLVLTGDMVQVPLTSSSWESQQARPRHVPGLSSWIR